MGTTHVRDEEYIDLLVRMLEHHEVWDQFVDTCNPAASLDKRGLIAAEVHKVGGEIGTGRWKALANAIREVQSDAVFGSPERCCVTGSTDVTWSPLFYESGFLNRRVHCSDLARKMVERVFADMPKEVRNYYTWNREHSVSLILHARKLYRSRHDGGESAIHASYTFTEDPVRCVRCGSDNAQRYTLEEGPHATKVALCGEHHGEALVWKERQKGLEPVQDRPARQPERTGPRCFGDLCGNPWNR